MPGYVSHTIMARDVYNKINNKNVDIDYMITYSLGGDLSKYSKCRWDSHHIKQDEFINNMCNYIKKNNLINDRKIIGVLYGHICHLIMDNMMHPLIRKIDKECVKDKKNHTLIEGYIDSYLARYKYNIGINKYDNKSLFKGRMNIRIYKMINYVYKETYGINYVGLFYIFNKFLYSMIRYLYKLLGVNLLIKLSGFSEFRVNNKDIDLVNNDRKINYIDYFGNNSNDNLIYIYEDSVKEAIKYINKVNKYLI